MGFECAQDDLAMVPRDPRRVEIGPRSYWKVLEGTRRLWKVPKRLKDSRIYFRIFLKDP
jgi:hypothetical protein